MKTFEQIAELERRYLLGTYNRYPIVLTRGKGVFLYDLECPALSRFCFGVGGECVGARASADCEDDSGGGALAGLLTFGREHKNSNSRADGDSGRDNDMSEGAPRIGYFSSRPSSSRVAYNFENAFSIAPGADVDILVIGQFGDRLGGDAGLLQYSRTAAACGFSPGSTRPWAALTRHKCACAESEQIPTFLSAVQSGRRARSRNLPKHDAAC